MNKKNYNQITQELQTFEQNPKLLAVTKYSDILEINEAIKAGVKMIGENRVESASEKFPLLVWEVEKHFIWVVQTKKLRKIALLFDVIESIGNIKQLEKIDFIWEELNKKITIFLQFNISREEQKSWFGIKDIPEILECSKELKYVNIAWIMWMGSKSEDSEIRKQFKYAKEIFETLKKEIVSIKELSIWMSNDYKIALEEWATIVRIGSKIFGGI
jgi:PLP dependent protein